MSHSSGSREPPRRRDATLRIEVLQRDNSNQDTWLGSLRTWARARGYLTFLLIKHNTHRVVESGDFTREGLLSTNIKQEPADEVTGVDDQELTEEELEEKAVQDQKSLADQHLHSKRTGRSYQGNSNIRRPDRD